MVERNVQALSHDEYKIIEFYVIKLAHAKYFWPEISTFKRRSSVLHSSKLKFLNPFLDIYDLHRAGGRLAHDNLN